MVGDFGTNQCVRGLRCFAIRRLNTDTSGVRGWRFNLMFRIHQYRTKCPPQ
jgi:hypothetical protein